MTENSPPPGPKPSIEETVHRPVLFDEVLEVLSPKEGGIYFDGTLGGGGHSLAIADRVGPKGLVIATDRDAAALDRVEARLAKEKSPGRGTVRMAQSDFADFPEVLEALHVGEVDGFLLDLGLSSDQLADQSRGFSFNAGGDLDLRFDASEGVPAWQLLRRWPAEKIADVIYKYGEERYSRRIAREIVKRRESAPLRKAAELAEICRRVIPRSPGRGRERIDPATRTFQALRIAVNDELGALERFLKRAPRYLKPGGIIAIISFHSLEDRIVKNAFRDTAGLDVLTNKPIEADAREKEENPRARSAKLRAAARPL